MSKKANPTIIGAFIIGAIALTIISLILIGGGKLFRDRQVFVTYFEGSLQGLRVGANVTFRGVRVGQVREVFIRFNESTLEFDSPVIIELEAGAIRTTIADQMSTQPVFRDQDGLFPEIPTVRNDIQQVIDSFHEFFSKLKDIPIDELFDDLTKSIKGIEKIVNSPELANTLKGVDKFINSTDTQELTKNLQHSILKLDATMNDIQTIVQNINQRVDPIANNLDATMDEMRIAIVEIQKTFTAVRDTITDENTRHQLNTALKEFTDSARSFRVFVEYLERHPESFISGKPVSQECAGLTLGEHCAEVRL